MIGNPQAIFDSLEPWTLDDPLWLWRQSQAHARLAYEHWRRERGATAYAVYRAAQDRADSAQDALHRATRTT
jgi:hypothetical protein